MMNKSVLISTLLCIGLVACNANIVNDAKQSSSKFQPVTQAILDDMAANLIVNYEHLSNVPGEHCDKNVADGNCFKAKLSLTSATPFKAKDWAIYFSHITPIQSADIGEFDIAHINGDLHKITPNNSFSGFAANQVKSLTFTAHYWSISESDLLPNYIITNDHLSARTIQSTKMVTDTDTQLQGVSFVKSYTNSETQFKRAKDDNSVIANAENLFNINAQQLPSTVDVTTEIIPKPLSTQVNSAGTLDLSNGLNVKLVKLENSVVDAALSRLATLGLAQTNAGVPLTLTLDEGLSVEEGRKTTGAKVAESYTLDITKQGITIQASDNAGAFYALQSLASLLDLENKSVPFVTIKDAPHYPFRGMLVDVGRNFHSASFMFKLIDQMAAYKMNKLHLHLAEDEGWRVEIDGLPELTDIGSKRCFDLTETHCLLPQLGAGTDSSAQVNGYYSKSEYKAIVAYAKAHHIQVIPSFDMPGHSRAAVKSMEARYKRFTAMGKPTLAKQYLLTDFADHTKYSSVQYYHDNTINVCLASSYDFVEKVVLEVAKLHQQAGQPLIKYHIGADETAGAWIDSPACETYIENYANANGAAAKLKIKDIGSHFIERVSNILADKQIEAAAWSDGLSHVNVTNMPQKVQANAWSVLAWEGHKVAHKMANQGWDIVLSQPDVTYFDFPYEADPKEHGYYWGTRSTNTRKVFEFMPNNLPVHAEFWRDRKNNPFEAIDDEPLLKGKTFIGVQGQLWSENTLTDTRAEYKIFPRVLALAERAWHKPNWAVPYQYTGQTYNKDTQFFTDEKQLQREKDWVRFASTLGLKELGKLDQADVMYRLPTVGGKIENNLLYINSAFPGLGLEYRISTGTANTSDNDWITYDAPVTVNNAVASVEVRAFSKSTKRKGRSLVVPNAG